ncbi:FtsB family cell division protein [Aeromicrobium sp. Sec7.5]|uniref:FtsB family cell division protein n=1 Tax=Aeromicrobium sp. Sec7.5 TaxID=3121276 RepID=UPI002FE4F6EE
MVLLAVMVLLIASYTASLHTWWQQQQEIRATEAKIETQKTAIAELEDDAERWEDPAYIEQQARARFGWVLPGEVGYRVVDADGEVEGDVPQLAEPPSAKAPQWYEKLWDSTKVAGQEPVEPTAPAEGPSEPLLPESP